MSVKPSDLYETPPEVFNPLHQEFGFNLDVCAQPGTEQCNAYFSPEYRGWNSAAASDGLVEDWGKYGSVAWCNPPYSRGQQRLWVEKALLERKRGVTSVLLLPADTSTNLFHELITPLIHESMYARYRGGTVPSPEVRFRKGRVRFLYNGVRQPPAKFGSLVVVLRGL